jgi:hypothetical protein
MGVACGVALGLGVVAAVDAGTQPASAQGGFTVTPEQLRINQNISSAAVKRSNRALNYLAPIRTTQSDNADDGSNGVKPLSSIPGSGAGWAIGQLARGQKQLWAVLGPTGAITAQSGPATGTGSFTSTRSAAGNYVVDFKTNVSACSWSASPLFPAGVAAQPFSAVTAGVANQPTQVNVRVFTVAASPSSTDSSVSVQVLC